jgi:hypothetical protein
MVETATSKKAVFGQSTGVIVLGRQSPLLAVSTEGGARWRDTTDARRIQSWSTRAKMPIPANDEFMHGYIQELELKKAFSNSRIGFKQTAPFLLAVRAPGYVG